MSYNRDKHHRRSLRLSGYDYSQNGAYFVTVCTQNRECLFGKIENGEMRLNDTGRMVCQCWQDIPLHFPNVLNDGFVVMPNHFHGILFIVGAIVGAKNVSPLQAKNVSPLQAKNVSPLQAKNVSPLQGQRTDGTSKTIGSIVRGFKIGVTKWMRNDYPGKNVWQRNYFEHIIRDDDDLNRIRKYIVENPAKWEIDRENPHAGNKTMHL